MEDVDIANAALALLGEEAITALTDTNNANARKLNAVYSNVRDEVLASHPWNFATKRANLTELGGLITTWTLTADPNVWSATLTLDEAPAYVYFDNNEGTEVASAVLCVADYNWYWASNVLYVYSATDPDTAYTNPGIDVIIREFEFDNAFSLPAACLRVLTVEDYTEFEIEGGILLTDEEEAKIKYIAQITDPTKFSIGFIQAFTARLASEVCFAITHNPNLTQVRYDDYQNKLDKAKSQDSQEGTPQMQNESSWIEEE